MVEQKCKIIIIFSTQRSGSTMVTSDFTQTRILGKPSEYFTEKILPGSKFNNCTLNLKEIQQEIKSILQKAKTDNGIVSIKIMSDYIVEVAKAIEKIGINKGKLQPSSNLTDQQKKLHLQKVFVDFFNSLDLDSKFIAFRVYRKDKVKQAVSRFVAAKTGLYHVWQNDRGQLVNHYDRPSDKATPFFLDIDNSYDYNQISEIIDSIYKEERELDIFLENFGILPTNLIYENIVKDTKYLKPIVKKIAHIKDVEVTNIPRKTIKTASKINNELRDKFNQDGGYSSKFERIFSTKKNVLKHISSFPSNVMVNESCFWNQEIIDISIDAPYLKQDDQDILIIGGVLITHHYISKIFVVDPIKGSQYQAGSNLKSEYYSSVYPKLSNSDRARFRCLVPLKSFTLENKKYHNIELKYVIEKSLPVKFVQIDISNFVK